MDKVIQGTILDALSGRLVSLMLVPFGVQRAEWMMALCLALGVFVGLLHIVAVEGPERKKER